MTIKKDIVFEVCAPKSKKVLIYGVRKLGQIEVRAVDSDRGDIEVGRIPDVWRENSNLDAELRAIRKLFKLPKERDIVVHITNMLSKVRSVVKNLEKI